MRKEEPSRSLLGTKGEEDAECAVTWRATEKTSFPYKVLGPGSEWDYWRLTVWSSGVSTDVGFQTPGVKR